MRNKIYLMRHGQTSWNKLGKVQGQSDIELNDTGINQAQQKLDFFNQNNVTFDIAFTSPLKRAKKTAQLVLESINYNGQLEDNLNLIERSFGELEGTCADINDPKCFSGEIKGIESEEFLIQRSKNFIKELQQNYTNKKTTIGMFSHSHTIKSILCAINPEKYDFSTFLGNCAIVEIEFDESSCRVVTIHD